MKSATVFRNIVLSSQVLSSMIGSSAFVLGMRSQRGQHSMLHASSAPISPTATTTATTLDNEENFEFDFIEAATKAAVERENRFIQQHLKEAPLKKKKVAEESKPIVLATTETETLPNEDDCELDFIEAATMAAVAREQREAQEKAELEAAAVLSSFAVYPAIVDQLPNARSQTLVQSE